ncbi:MAG: SLC13 family permease [Deltaproteobacteria bacterium]
MNFPAIIALSVFVLSYAVIISEKLHKTIIALVGAAVLVLFGVLSQEEAIGFIDFNTIGLLAGMMIIVSVIKQTGLFEYLAIRQAKKAKGNPVKIMISFLIITAILSAFLDNVTTIIVIVPVTLNICRLIGVNPIPFVICEIFASNIGGTATLIGDPPNILIGSATQLSFSDFIWNLAPISIICILVSIFAFKLIFKKDLQKADSIEKLMEMDEKNAIVDSALLIKSLIVTSLVILGFFLHGALHIGTASIALAGAAILLTIAKVDVEEAFDGVEWTTIFFFVGLFILVGGLEKTGILKYLAKLTFESTGGNILLTGLAILWVSAILSAFIDNIPFVATMIPMIRTFGELSGAGNIDFLWWCLALGACFGGNGTIIGASANVIGVDALKNSGYSISFKEFFKIAFPVMILTMVIATIYARIVLYH